MDQRQEPSGPCGLPVVGNLPYLKPELHTCFEALSRTYGPVMRLRLRLRLGTETGIVISSSAAGSEVLCDHDATLVDRNMPGLAVASGESDNVFSPYGAGWQMLRKLCVMEVLGGATLDAVYEVRCREIRNTIRALHNRVGSRVNIGEEMSLMALNAMTGILWGMSVEGEEREYRGGGDGDFGEAQFVGTFFPGFGRLHLRGRKKQLMAWS